MVAYGFSRFDDGWMVFADGIGDDGIGGMSPLRLRRLFVDDDGVSHSDDDFESVGEIPQSPPIDNDDDSDDDVFYDSRQSLSPESFVLPPLEESQVPLTTSDKEEESSDPEIPPPEEQLGSFWDEKGRRRSWRLRLKAGLGGG